MNDERFARLHEQSRRILAGLQAVCRFPASDLDDMGQEMAVALAGLDDETDSYCLAAAMWGALGWLRRTYGRQVLHGVRQAPDLVGLIDSGRWRCVWC
ncbi:MAG TPA: hypothetical protein P5532_22780 [Planctomycetota bacterium]|nr:hypothetical protein [Planctomycetota bacterium]HRT97252.1 hypothetical protein [Planctomycetota bacterium]